MLHPMPPQPAMRAAYLRPEVGKSGVDLKLPQAAVLKSDGGETLRAAFKESSHCGPFNALLIVDITATVAAMN